MSLSTLVGTAYSHWLRAHPRRPAGTLPSLWLLHQSNLLPADGVCLHLLLCHQAFPTCYISSSKEKAFFPLFTQGDFWNFFFVINTPWLTIVFQSHSWAYIQAGGQPRGEWGKHVVQKHTRISMFTQNYSQQPGHGCNLNGHWQRIGKRRHVVHIYTRECYWAIQGKKETMPPAATWMELEAVMLIEAV